MKVLLNYKPLDQNYKGYPYVHVLDNSVVFAELPICIGEFGKTYNKPILYGNFNGVPTVHEEEEVKEKLQHLKLFHFKVEENRLIEVQEDEADIHIHLPKDTPVNELVYENGDVFWAKPVDEKIEEQGSED